MKKENVKAYSYNTLLFSTESATVTVAFYNPGDPREQKDDVKGAHLSFYCLSLSDGAHIYDPYLFVNNIRGSKRG